LAKCGTLGKERNTWQSGDTWLSAAHLAKCGTLGKERNTWQIAAHLAKFGTLGKVRHTWQPAQHLDKCGTLKKCVTQKSGAHLKNVTYSTHGKVCQKRTIALMDEKRCIATI